MATSVGTVAEPSNEKRCLAARASTIEHFVEVYGVNFLGVLCTLLPGQIELDAVTDSAAVRRLQREVGLFGLYTAVGIPAHASFWTLRNRLREAQGLLQRIDATRSCAHQSGLFQIRAKSVLLDELAILEQQVRSRLTPLSEKASKQLNERLRHSPWRFVPGHISKCLSYVLDAHRVERTLAQADRITLSAPPGIDLPAPLRQARLLSYWQHLRQSQRDLHMLRRLARSPGLAEASLCSKINGCVPQLLDRIQAASCDLVSAPQSRRDLWRGFPWLWFFTPTGWSLLLALVLRPQPRTTVLAAA